MHSCLLETGERSGFKMDNFCTTQPRNFHFPHRLGLGLAECSAKGYRKQVVGPNQPWQLQTKFHGQNTSRTPVSRSAQCSETRWFLATGTQTQWHPLPWKCDGRAREALGCVCSPSAVPRGLLQLLWASSHTLDTWPYLWPPFFNIMRLRPYTS